MSARQLPHHAGWLPAPDKFRDWVKVKLRGLREVNGGSELGPVHPVIKDFHDFIEKTPIVREAFSRMFFQTMQNLDARGLEQVSSYTEMLKAFNLLLFTAPTFDDQRYWGGVIAFPFNAIIDWPMASPAGLQVFNMPEVNAKIKNIFDVWAKYLSSKDSRDEVLFNKRGDKVGWFSPEGVKYLEQDLYSVPPGNFNPQVDKYPLATFVDTFECDPKDPTEAYGYTSWDDFFTRKFREDVRKVEAPKEDNVIVAACESDLNRIWLNVKEVDAFWVKGQPYSVHDIINYDPEWKGEFGTGSCVFQAFLSARAYHRWGSPVKGTVVKSFVVPGAYFALSPSADLDPSAPDLSQPYISQVATRAVFFIKADNKKIGLMAVITIGMADVSGCEITVNDGQAIEKGAQLGMFHHGGSSHCLVFRPETAKELKWNPKYIYDPPTESNPQRDYEDDGKHHIFFRQKIASVPA